MRDGRELIKEKCGACSTVGNCRALPITLGAFGVSGFHLLVVIPVGTIQNQHARESSLPIKEGMPPRIEKDEGTKTEGESEKPRHVLACV